MLQCRERQAYACNYANEDSVVYDPFMGLQCRERQAYACNQDL